MAFLDIIGARDKSAQSPSQTQSAPDAPEDKPTEAPTPLVPPSGDPATVQNTSSVDPPSASDVIPAATGQSDSASGLSPPPVERSAFRLSFPANFRRFRKPKSPLSPTTEELCVTAAPAASTYQAKKGPLASSLSNADRRAKQAALILRSLIVGQDTDQGGVSPQPRISSTQLKSVKAQLLKPKSAAKIIAQLRALPALTNSAASRASEPIQAVCLPYTDEEADQQYLSSLRNLKQLPPPPPTTTTTTRAAEAASTATSSIGSSPILGATIESVAEAFRNLHVVNLLKGPDLGLGQPGDGPGLLAGAIPTAETVINGIVQITPQLMALSYATGKAIIPDHQGIYPPTDRISVLTYWWGMEVLLPTPTLAYLSRAQSISGTIINFLTALGIMYEGVREILPFVRYFSQYIDFEFNAIKSQDRGKGVVCASTWIMPAAIVPRPWDFADPPKNLDLHTPSPYVKAPVAVPPSQTTLDTVQLT